MPDPVRDRDPSPEALHGRVPVPDWAPGRVPDPSSVPDPRHLPDRDHEADASGWTSDPGHGHSPADVTSRTERALQTARAGYARAHGHPLDRAPHVARRRVRWAVPWRLAGAAGVALLVVAGAVTLRATTTAPGTPVVLPTPAPAGNAAGSVAGSVAGSAAGGAAVDRQPEGPADGSAPDASTGPTSSAAVVVAPVVVHVVGAVATPGVVRLPTGSRVVDALAAAGGATPDADLASLNLARVLVDGEQVVVLRPGESGPAAAPTTAGGAPGLVDVNSADAAALDALPGIGPVLAQRIVEHRAERPFTTVDELGDVPGIGPTLLERLRPLVSV
jgi:competence protein ComEA